MTKLAAAAMVFEKHNERLIAREKSNRWEMLSLAMLVVFLVRGLAGIMVEKRQTANLLSNMAAQAAR